MSESTLVEPPILKPENRFGDSSKPTQFKPGQTGNPGGRPKGFAAYVREKTEDGKKLVRLQLAIAMGKLTITRKTSDGIPYEQTPGFDDRQKAIEWLADRGFGKAAQLIELSGPNGGPIEVCDSDVVTLERRFLELQLASKQ